LNISDIDIRDTRCNLIKIDGIILLFLDFDGVLHGFKDRKADLAKRVLLEEVLRAHLDVYVVFSTNWRFSHSLEMLTNYFSKDLRHRFVGTNPTVQKMQNCALPVRQAECLKFMEDIGFVGKWVALDDAQDLFEKDDEHVIIVDGDYGMTYETVIKLKNLIGNKNDTSTRWYC
jgi:hypothetical protein